MLQIYPRTCHQACLVKDFANKAIITIHSRASKNSTILRCVPDVISNQQYIYREFAEDIFLLKVSAYRSDRVFRKAKLSGIEMLLIDA
jgi:hypothetical protein